MFMHRIINIDTMTHLSRVDLCGEVCGCGTHEGVCICVGALTHVGDYGGQRLTQDVFLDCFSAYCGAHHFG